MANIPSLIFEDPNATLHRWVLRKNEPVGRLESTSRGGRFVYNGFWLFNVPPEDRGVAQSLPPRDEPYESEHDPGLPAFFVNLLPEGETATRRARRGGGRTDPVAWLGAIGTDAVGDVTLGNADGPAPKARLSRIPASVPFREAYSRLLEEPLGPCGAIPGVQPKISIDRITLPKDVKAGPGAFLKFTTDDRFPLAAENEAFFMAMATDGGLPTARIERIVDTAGESALLIHRFDRRTNGRKVRQLHQEDALQLLDLYPSDKYSTTVEEIGEAVRKVVASWPQSGTDLILQFAFGYLIGNHDQHAKNVSILEVSDDLWGLSPVYDMLSTLVYGDQVLALKLNGNDEELTRADFVALTRIFGIREEPVLRRLDLMLDKARPWLDRLGEIGFDPLLTERLRGALLERHAALVGERNLDLVL